MTRVLSLVAVAALLAGCGGFQPDMPGVERELAAAIEEQTEARTVKVECPDSIDWQAGSDFRCFAEDARGNRAKVTVYMENGDGAYSWELG